MSSHDEVRRCSLLLLQSDDSQWALLGELFGPLYRASMATSALFPNAVSIAGGKGFMLMDLLGLHQGSTSSILAFVEQ